MSFLLKRASFSSVFKALRLIVKDFYKLLNVIILTIKRNLILTSLLTIANNVILCKSLFYNNIAKRLNDILIVKVYIILIKSDINYKYWSKFVCTTNYLRICLFFFILKITFYEKINNYKSNLSYIRVLDSKVFAHVNKTTIKIDYFKLYVIKCKLINYKSNKSIYCLINSFINKLVYFLHVYFIERIFKSLDIK